MYTLDQYRHILTLLQINKHTEFETYFSFNSLFERIITHFNSNPIPCLFDIKYEDYLPKYIRHLKTVSFQIYKTIPPKLDLVD